MVHTSAIATGVAIIGMMKTARKKPRNGNLAWNTAAASVPKISGSRTESTV
jgi:hypothetical protein